MTKKGTEMLVEFAIVRVESSYFQPSWDNIGIEEKYFFIRVVAAIVFGSL